MPWVDARLPGGVRLHAVVPPLAPEGTHVSLRVLRPVGFDLDALVARGTLPSAWAAVLAALVRRRAAFLVSGGTGAGKTTLLAALLGLVPPTERILLVEDVGELRPDHPHVVRLEARHANVEGRGAVALDDLVRQALRMRPDRIVVGECRGPEVRELLAALNTGHAGGCGTVHANACSEVPARLEALGSLAGMSPRALAGQVAAAIDVVVHVERSCRAAPGRGGRGGRRGRPHRPDRRARADPARRRRAGPRAGVAGPRRGAAPAHGGDRLRAVTADLAAGAAAAAAVRRCSSRPPVEQRLRVPLPAGPGRSPRGRLVRSVAALRTGRRGAWTAVDLEVVLAVLDRVSALLRAGLGQRTVWNHLAAAPGPARPLCAYVAESLSVGGSSGSALRGAADLLRRNGSGGTSGAALVPGDVLRWLAVATTVSDRTGAPAADCVDRLAAAVRAELAAADERAAALAGPQATAQVLGWLPAAGVVLGALVGAEPVRVLLLTGPGRLCLVAGLLLWATGRGWSRALVRRAAAAAG